MMTRQWEILLRNARRFVKEREDRARLIASTLFLLFMITLMCILASEAHQQLSGPMSMIALWTTLSSPVSKENLAFDEAFIRGTSIVGRDAVQKFRSHLDCFSESGKWVYNPTPTNIIWNVVGDRYTDVCENRRVWSDPHDASLTIADIAARKTAGTWPVREELKWVWQTNSSCPWQSINRDQFCRKIGAKRHIMIVGDSINHEISWSVMNALIVNGSYERLDGSTRFILGPYEMCDDIFGKGNGFNVSYICNVHLTTVNESSIKDVNDIERPWINTLDEYDTKILLLNKGAHYENDTTYIDGLRKVFTILREKYPDTHIIYRNTPPGHVDCMNFTRPLDEPQYDIAATRYHWEEFESQNRLAKELVDEFGYTYMDVYTMVKLRPEGHISQRDCLHYCLPGPLDIATESLYNILLLL